MNPSMYRLVINRYSHTKTETTSEGCLDPIAQEIGVVDQPYHNASMFINVERPSQSLRGSLGCRRSAPRGEPLASGCPSEPVGFLHWPVQAADDIFLRHFIAIVSITSDTSRKVWKDDLQKADGKDAPVWVGLGDHTLCGDSRWLHGRRRTRRRPRFRPRNSKPRHLRARRWRVRR